MKLLENDCLRMVTSDYNSKDTDHVSRLEVIISDIEQAQKILKLRLHEYKKTVEVM